MFPGNRKHILGKWKWTNTSFDYGKSRVQKRVSIANIMEFFLNFLNPAYLNTLKNEEYWICDGSFAEK